MPRPLTSAGRAALEGRTIAVAYLLEVVTDEGAMRINHRNTALTYDSQTWDPAPNDWILPDGIPISRALVPETFEMQFDGSFQDDTSTFIGLLLTRTWHQRPVRFFGLLLDTADYSVIDTHMEWRGKLDQLETEEAPGQPSRILMRCESGVFRARETNMTTCSDADQRRRSATDTFFANTALKQGQKVPYGRTWASIPGGQGAQSSGGIANGWYGIGSR